MVSETTNLLFAGVISGWVVAVTKPACEKIDYYLIKDEKFKIIKFLFYFIIYLLWLIVLLSIIIMIYN